jgi:hypothetical protein
LSLRGTWSVVRTVEWNVVGLEIIRDTNTMTTDELQSAFVDMGILHQRTATTRTKRPNDTRSS